VFIAYILDEWNAHDERVESIRLPRCSRDPRIKVIAGLIKWIVSSSIFIPLHKTQTGMVIVHFI